MNKNLLILFLGILLISSFAFADLRDRIGGGTGGIRIRPILPPTIIDATINTDTQQFLIDAGLSDYNKSEIKCDADMCFMRVWNTGNFDFFVRTAKKYRSPICVKDLFDSNRTNCSGYEWLDKSVERVGIELDRLADKKLEAFVVQVQETPVEITPIRGMQNVTLISQIIGGGGIIGGILDTINHIVTGN